MAAGTRRGGDVMGNMPEDEDIWEPPYPVNFGIPDRLAQAPARVQVLHERLLILYKDIATIGNDISSDKRFASKCTPIRCGKSWASMHDIYERNIKSNERDHEDACKRAMTLIGEVQALGYVAFIPAALGGVLHRRNVVPFGSMSYLAKSPHYFSTEVFPVPGHLPVGNANYNGPIRTIQQANSYLSRKFGMMARQLNRARYFRDWRVRCGASPSALLPYNSLTGEINSCRRQFLEAIHVIKQFEGSPQLFTMPNELRDLLLADNGVMSLGPPEDVACLFPGGSYNPPGRVLYLLFEAASGYALFNVYGQVDLENIVDWEIFRLAVGLEVYYPFSSAADALQQCDAISKGTMTVVLKSLLENYLPDPNTSCWKQYCLGVNDENLGKFINRETGINYKSTSYIQDLFCGIRLHFHRYIEVEESKLGKTQLCLAHNHSRMKIQFCVDEQMAMQAILLLDDIDMDINTSSGRVREWFSTHFPELVQIVNDISLYARIAEFMTNQPHLAEIDVTALVGIVGNDKLAKRIVEAAKASMGYPLLACDLDILRRLTVRVLSLLDSRNNIHEYLMSKMKIVAPNLTALVGEVVGARLISHAGGLSKLAECSPSTLRRLGARNLKGGEAKSGAIFDSNFVVRTSEAKKELMVQWLTTKCLLASWADNLGGTTSEAGQEYYQEAESLLKLYGAEC